MMVFHKMKSAAKERSKGCERADPRGVAALRHVVEPVFSRM